MGDGKEHFRISRMSSPAPRRWWPRPPYTLLLCTIFLLFSLFIYSSLHLFYPLISRYTSIPFLPQCSSDSLSRPPSLSNLPAQEKYMFYAPHSGFSNQVGELKNALIIAALLNRTLILPPVFDHHAVWLGSCPKYKVQEPEQMRFLAWSHISELIRNGRYVAIGDIIDLSRAVFSSLVKTIDLRVFLSLWCGVDLGPACSGTLCNSLMESVSTWGTLESCTVLLSKPDKLHRECIYGVIDDCRTTIWMHGQKNHDSLYPNITTDISQSINQNSQQDLDLKKRKISTERRYKDIVEVLGPGSVAAEAQVLAFGSLFSSEYKGSQLHVEVRSSLREEKISTLYHLIELLPFTPEITNAGKLYAEQEIQRPFFCAQIRLLDGQFKNHWKKTFSNLKAQLDRIRNEGSIEALHLFLMTDLPPLNWTGTYLGELAASPSLFKLHQLNGREKFILDAAEKLMKREYGLRSGFLPSGFSKSGRFSGQVQNHTPDILLYVEEVICSCASLGFVGTTGSTIADNILQLRNAKICTSARIGME